MTIASVDINLFDEGCLIYPYGHRDQLRNAGPVLGLERQ